jgi:thiamine transport system ATP-binding protein
VLEADVEVDRRLFTVRASLRVADGERLALFGPSGAGKTTLLEAIAGLVPVRSGRVTLRGRTLTSTQPPRVRVPVWQRGVGLLRQQPALFPHLSVAGNLRYGLGTGREDDRSVDSLAQALGIGGLLQAMPARLSGGQAHRVALCRLLLAGCDTLLLDEPYAGLDHALRRRMTGLVVSFAADRQLPAVLVAHELSEAQAFAHRLAVLDRGRVLQVGPPDQVVLRPASRRVAELVGYLGFVSAGPQGDGPVAGIHPERVVPGARPEEGLVLAGRAEAWRPAGAGWEVDLRTCGVLITCRLAARTCDAGGDLVLTALGPPWFGPDGRAVPATRPARQRTC